MVFFGLSFLIASSIFGYLFFQEKQAQANVRDSSAEIVQKYQNNLKKHPTVSTKKEKKQTKLDSNGLTGTGALNETPSYKANIKNLTNAEIKRVKTHIGKLLPYVVGTIKAPSIDLNLPIFEGFSRDKLAVGAGTMKPNQSVDTVGNFALAGHNMNTNRSILFSKITKLKGKDVTINYKGKKKVYTIKGVYQIKATEVQHIEDTQAIAQKKKILTLITCTVDGVDRFMVQGEEK